MTRRSKIWVIVAWLFTLFNLGWTGYAAANGEGLHALAHGALAAVGAFFAWRIPRRSRLQQLPAADEVDQRLDRLQQSVDAVAVEVERVGEAQRFTARLAAELAEKPFPEAVPPRRRPNEES
jgi:hypothetical protein